MTSGLQQPAGPTATVEPAARGNRTVYLHPGQLLVALVPTTIVTILGSCVAVSLHDPKLAIGGLNHFLLPHQAESATGSPRFGGPAIRQLHAELLRRGAEAARLRAKVFGGACVLEANQGSASPLGNENARLAEMVLAQLGVPVIASDLGGQRGRKLRFDTDSGDAWVRTI